MTRKIDITPFLIQSMALRTLESGKDILHCFPNVILGNDNIKIYLFCTKNNNNIEATLNARISSLKRTENKECVIHIKSNTSIKEIIFGHIKTPVLSKQTNNYIQRCSANVTLDDICSIIKSSNIEIIVDGDTASLNVTDFKIPLILYCGYIFDIEILPKDLKEIATERINEYIATVEERDAKERKEREIENNNFVLNSLENKAISAIKRTITFSTDIYGKKTYNLDGIKQVLSSPESITEVNDLQSFCKKKRLKSEKLDFIKKLKTPPKKEEIIKELERLEKNVKINTEKESKWWYIKKWLKHCWYGAFFMAFAEYGFDFLLWELFFLDDLKYFIISGTIIGTITYVITWIFFYNKDKDTSLNEATKTYVRHIEHAETSLSKLDKRDS